MAVKRFIKNKDGNFSMITALMLGPLLACMTIAIDYSELSRHRAILQSALDALPVDQRDVVVLGYFEGLSSSEIAARVGVPLGTVKSRAAAAMAKLRASLLPGGAA